MAEDRCLTQNTLTAYAELLARHGRPDELREPATGQDAHAVPHLYADALRDHGRAEEAGIVMRDAIATDDWVECRAWLSSALLRDDRLDDAITVAEPGFGRHGPWRPSRERSFARAGSWDRAILPVAPADGATCCQGR
jgi:hypothetical protein